MKVFITVGCMINGMQVLPDIKAIEVRDDVARHLIAECKAIPAQSVADQPKKAISKKDEINSGGENE
jgi:hypothetical protein